MVALTSRMQHERNYNDEQLERLTKLRRLDVDPTRVEMGWIMTFAPSPSGTSSSASAEDGRFPHAVQVRNRSELGAHGDSLHRSGSRRLKERLNNITVAFDKRGKPVTTATWKSETP